MKRFASLVLAFSLFTSQAFALDILALIPRELGNQEQFRFTLNVSNEFNNANVLGTIFLLICFPFAIANDSASSANLAQINAKLAQQGYSEAEIAAYNSDLMNIVGPHFNGRTVTLEQFKSEVKSLGLQQSTLEAMLVQ